MIPHPDPLPIIRRYSAGEITAMQAATLLGEPHSVNDVVYLLRQAHLPPPLPPQAQQDAELAHARKILGQEPSPACGRGQGEGRAAQTKPKLETAQQPLPPTQPQPTIPQ